MPIIKVHEVKLVQLRISSYACSKETHAVLLRETCDTSSSCGKLLTLSVYHLPLRVQVCSLEGILLDYDIKKQSLSKFLHMHMQ